MIEKRLDSFASFLGLKAEEVLFLETKAQEAAHQAEGMTHLQDYLALGALALAFKPKKIFEIGTYLGITANFFLDLLPTAEVVSIAYVNPSFLGRKFNNSELSRKDVGSRVSFSNKKRFTQMLGNSHKLNPFMLKQEYGLFDMVFIDGDHSFEGVQLDTELASAILSEEGILAWHDANPKERYLPVRNFLEKELLLSAIATQDTYIGGVAASSKAIVEKLLCPI